VYRMYVSYMSGIFDFTGTQMVLTMKLTSFAYNMFDGHYDAKVKTAIIMMMMMMMMIMIYISMDVYDAICFHRKCFLPSRMTTRKMLRCTVIEPSMRSRSCPTRWSSSAISTASLAFWVRIRMRVMIDCDDDVSDNDSDYTVYVSDDDSDRIVMMRRRRGVMIIMI